MNLTEEQKRAIAEEGRIIVSASAGSGKTFVMIERLVAYILGGGSVDRILAVTFTKKAAAQMRDRLRKAILKGIHERSGEEAARLKEQLPLLPLADISTIDALCTRLLRTYFFVVKADPAFRVVPQDSPEGQALVVRALDETFEAAYAQPSEGFSRLLEVYFHKKQDTKLRDMVCALYKEVSGQEDAVSVLEWARTVQPFDDVCSYLYEYYMGRVQSCKAYVQQAKETAVALQHKTALKRIATMEQIFAALEGCRELSALCSLDEMRVPNALSKSDEMEGAERAMAVLLAKAGTELRSLLKTVRGYRIEEERVRCQNAQEYASALAELTLAFEANYTRLKREANALDYNDIAHLALAILKDENIIASLKDKYSRVFVDEYQDVNPVQEKLVSLLSGENVFLVGDAKQAIYGFRGSRSEYFERKERDFGTTLRLSTNFRSAPAILKTVNRVFLPIWEGYVPMLGGERYGEHQGKVAFHFVKKEEKEAGALRDVYSVFGQEPYSEEHATAREVLRLVREELGSRYFDPDSQSEKTVTYGDIAILVRNKSTIAAAVVRALSKECVPVVSATEVNVCDFFEARLVIDWLSYIDNAEQDIPMATALLSFPGGFCESELAAIRLACPGVYAFRNACARYCADRKEKQDELARKLERFYARVQRYRALARLRTAAEMCELLLSEGLEAQIASGGGGSGRLARVRRLIAEGEGMSVNAFLRRLKDGNMKFGFSESGGEDAVKVLTIHGSKGLEYPVVILPELCGHFRGGERLEFMWTDRFGSAVKCFHPEEKTMEETLVRTACSIYEQEKDVREERNLLYVAMTRAKMRLHLLFTEKGKALSPAYARCMCDYFDFDALSDYWENGEAELPALPRTQLAAKADEGEVQRILAVYKQPYRYESSARLPVKSSATELLEKDEDELRFVAGQGASREEGVAYHAFLQHVVFGADAAEERARMRTLGLIDKEQDALLDTQKLRAILALPSVAALAGKRVWREQTFLLRLPATEVPQLGSDAQDEVVFQGAFDLLTQDEAGYLILDYKYSGREDASLKAHYAPQIALYKKAVARIFRVDERTVRARILNIKLCREIEM